jgi:Outer membrane protein beta-barrel domain
MSKHLFRAGSIAALAFALAAPLEAQSPSFQITPYAGYLKSGTMVNGPVGTALRNGAAPVYGAELAVGLTRSLLLVGNAAYSKPELEIGAPVVGGMRVGESSVLLYDAALRLGLPLPSSSITPFVQAGVGEMRQTLDVGPASTRSTAFAYNVGGGMDIRIAPKVGLQLMAKDYIVKFGTQEASGIEVDTKTTHNWALSAGVRLGI